MKKQISDKNRQKLINEYEDSLFRLVLYDAAEKGGSQLNKNSIELVDENMYIPTQAQIIHFSKMLDSHYRKSRKITKRRYPVRFAVAILIVTIMFSTAMLTADAFRVNVLNLLIKVNSKYASFQLSDEIPSAEKVIVDWHNSYMPVYIPEGYELSSSFNTDPVKKLTFVNEQIKDSFITYMECNQSTSIAVDTENASLIETIVINDDVGTIVEKNSRVSIVWSRDERMFLIEGYTSREEIIKMAEGVAFIN